MFDSSAYFLFLVWHNAFRMTWMHSKRYILRRQQPWSALHFQLSISQVKSHAGCVLWFHIRWYKRQNCSQIPLSCFLYLEVRPISRPGVAWQYINSDSFSGKDVAALQRWPRYPVSAEEKIKQINHNPAKKSLSWFEFSRLIRRTSSPGTTALFTSRKRKIQRVIQKRAGILWHLTRLAFTLVQYLL